MTGANLFDCLVERGKSQIVDQEDAETLRALAEQMVAAAIASIKTLRPLRPRMFPLDATPENLALAKALRAEFEQWVSEAHAAYERSRALVNAGVQVANHSELDDLIGLTQAMLTITLDSHLQSLDDPCKPWSIEEARRELYLQRRG
jgi:hypothetical protein